MLPVDNLFAPFEYAIGLSFGKGFCTACVVLGRRHFTGA